MNIVVTGRAYDLSGNFVDRDTLTRMCRAVDIYVSDTMSHRADVLVASDDAIRKRTTKVKEAERVGASVWSYTTLFSEIRTIQRQRSIAAETPAPARAPTPAVPAPALDPSVAGRVGLNNGRPLNPVPRQAEDWAAIDLLPFRLYKDYQEMIDAWTITAQADGLLIEWWCGPEPLTSGHGNDVIRFRVLKVEDDEMRVILPKCSAQRANEFMEGYATALAERNRAAATHRPVSRRLKL